MFSKRERKCKIKVGLIFRFPPQQIIKAYPLVSNSTKEEKKKKKKEKANNPPHLKP